MIIVIDGPAGSGKSSTAREVADRMKIQYLDSGALYRALTLLFVESGEDKKSFFELLNQSRLTFHYADGIFYVQLDYKDITEQLRTPEVSERVSEVAAMPESRVYVNRLMHEVVDKDTYIAEGRDLGTAVFPDADLKFFMSADLDERAWRRYDELKEKEPSVSLEQVKENLKRRDEKDSQRKSDPLKKAKEAFEIDTTHSSFEQQVRFICSKIEEMMENN